MYCSMCGAAESPNPICDECNNEEFIDDLIKFYFHNGYPYDAIVGLLNKREGIHMSLRTLKRRLRSLGLRRKGNRTRVDENFVRNKIIEEMDGPGKLAGYRSIWHALRIRHGIHVPRALVASVMKETDPEGVNQRRSRRLRRRTFISRGANATWHMDGYDKLKPFGFAIHGAIDGFSRKILWLEVVKSNNDPRIPARLYLDSIREAGGCPMVLVSDCGTENGIAAAMQCTFRVNGEDEYAGEMSHRYCSSPANQRIECWWSFLRRNRSNWWINLFKDILEYGYLHLGNVFDMQCLWFCYAKVIQNDLNQVRDHWNSHKITKSGYNVINGIPDIMYHLPEYYGMEECLVPISEQAVLEVEHHCEPNNAVDNDLYTEYFEYVLETEGYSYPGNHYEAFELFQAIMALQNNQA